MPRLTKDPWFGPKRYVGWGWAPRSWQGWLTTAAMVGLVIIAVATVRGPVGFAVALIVIILFLVLAWLTGTAPGVPGL